ncbi:MAG: hypothetical protein OEX02_17880 [Cyclobacteriaceae bacterium]|nr:hypothetical protein [Cyclobacteriaceae bacterium]
MIQPPEYENSPELSGKYLGGITKDFIVVSANLKEASYQIRKRGYSDYPIFPICRVDQPIGQLLIAKSDFDLSWDIYATYLNEFVEREIIDIDRLDDFTKAYKDPDEFCCLFVIDGAFTSFVYIPYPEDD